MSRDAALNLDELKQRIHAFAEARDWLQFHSPKNLSMAIAGEAAELMEHFLWCTGKASRDALANPAKRAAVAEELADIVIYCLQFANVTELDLAAAIEAKLAINAEKYPVAKARGRADKYDAL